MARAGDENHIEIVLVDQPVEVDVGEGLAGVGAPVAEESASVCSSFSGSRSSGFSFR